MSGELKARWGVGRWLSVALFFIAGCSDDSAICAVDEDCYEGAVCTEDGRCLPEGLADGGRPSAGGAGGAVGGAGGAVGGAGGGAVVDGGVDAGPDGEPDIGPIPPPGCETACRELTVCAVSSGRCGGLSAEGEAARFADEICPVVCADPEGAEAAREISSCDEWFPLLLQLSAVTEYACIGDYRRVPTIPGAFPSVCGVPEGGARGYLLRIPIDDLQVDVTVYMIFDGTDGGAVILYPIEQETGRLIESSATTATASMRWGGEMGLVVNEWQLPPGTLPSPFEGVEALIGLDARTSSCDQASLCGEMKVSLIEPVRLEFNTTYQSAEISPVRGLIDLEAEQTSQCP